MPKRSVTVCIATYNQREWIEQCVRSVIEQHLDAGMRVLIGDDASDDGTSDIVARYAALYPGTITHIRHPQRMGAYDNTRVLLTRADGDFTACVDGDDYWLPGKLARQVAYLQSHPHCAAVFTNALTVDADSNPIGLFNDVGDARFDLVAMLRHGNFLNNSSIMFRCGGLTECLADDTPIIDYFSHLHLARSGWLGQIGEPLTVYRVSTRGSMVRSANAQVREMYWEAIRSVPRELVSDNDFAHGLADFLRRVTFRAARTRHFGLLRDWTPRVYAASPYGKVRTSALTVAALARVAGKLIAMNAKNLLRSHKANILYIY
jgi:glycosyltransferase involved in cell wall biosynthesis